MKIMDKTTLPNKIAIIAGQGRMPREIYDLCIQHGVEGHVIGLDGQIDMSLFDGIHVHLFPIHAISQIIKNIKSHGIKDIILAGRVKRIVIPKLMLDLKGAKLFTKIIASGLSDKSLTKTIINFLEKEGFNVLSPEVLSPNESLKPGNLTNITIRKNHMRDIERGVKMLTEISRLDVGQALVIQNGLILGVEAVEGTDELIKRCGAIRQKFDTEPVLVKICKPGQDKRMDMPCIGDQTIRIMHEFGVRGIALQVHSCLILNRNETIALANKLGVFIYCLQ